jgi:Na+-translocating ferredoxin:NAD+ oxidoreductase RnfD subunit
MILVLVLLTVLAAPGEGLERVAPNLLTAVVIAGLIDALILRVLRHRQTQHKWEFPSGAVLSAMFVVMVFSGREPWHVGAITSVVAVLSKYVLRTKAGNIFNPAALAIVISFYVFHTAQSWWGALPDLPMWTISVLVAAGYFIADRVNKVPLALAFLGTYFLLFTGVAFFGDPGAVSEIFRSPDLHAAIFFAFFFLTDPPTSPVTYQGQLICGVLVAVASFAIFEGTGAVHYLLSGVLVGNVYEAVRRGRPISFSHLGIGRPAAKIAVPARS